MSELSSPPVDRPTLRALDLFIGRINARYRTTGVILFGSRARGDHRADSDADVAVLLSGPPERFLPTKLAMADLAFEIMLETGIRIEPLPVWESEWSEPSAYSNPRLLENIAREGRRL